MAKDKYVQLGEEAAEGSFYDPTLSLKVLPGQLVKLPKNYRTSKKTLSALRGGHLAVADSEDVTKFLKGKGKVVKTDDADDADDNTDVVMTEAIINKMNMDKLKAYILENQVNEDEAEIYTAEELEKEKKADLLGIALEVFEETNSED